MSEPTGETNKASKKPMGIVVIISGPVSSGKSPIAQSVSNAAKAEGLRVTVDDHRLFRFDEGHIEQLTRAIVAAKATSDLGIIVVGTGIRDSVLTIKVDPAIPNWRRVMGWLGQSFAPRQDLPG